MLLATIDEFALLILPFVIGGFGQWLIQSFTRLRHRERAIYRIACLAGAVTGLLFAFGIVGPSDLMEALMALVLVGAWATFFWYGVLAVIVFGWEYTIGALFRASSRRRENRQRQQEEVRRAQQEREQARQLAAYRSEQSTRQQAEQSRRDDARFELRAYYDSHPELLQKLPPNRFERYLNEDLSDQHPAEKVEERAQKLLAMMEQMLGGRKSQQWQSEEDIVEHYTNAMQKYGAAGMYSQMELETLQSELRMKMHRELEDFRNGS